MDEIERKVILGYDVESLKKNIERANKNIEVFTEAIEKERRQIELLGSYIKIIEAEKGR